MHHYNYLVASIASQLCLNFIIDFLSLITDCFTSFFGIMFESDRETGYSIQRLCGSLAFAVLFVCSIFFNTLWLLVVSFIIAMPMFLMAEWKYGHEMKNKFLKCQEYYKSMCVNCNKFESYVNISLSTGQTKYSL